MENMSHGFLCAGCGRFFDICVRDVDVGSNEFNLKFPNYSDFKKTLW